MSGRGTDPRTREGSFDAEVDRRAQAPCPARWEQESRSGDAVARALTRGRRLEDLGCFLEALHVYDEALAAPDDQRTVLDAGRLTHRVVGCALATGDVQRAFASYVAAARHARDLGMLRHCGESLASAGWCLAVRPVAACVASVLSGDLVEGAFGGVLEDVSEVLLTTGDLSMDHAMLVHSRFAGLMILSTEALLDRELAVAAEALYFDVLSPFSTLHDVPSRTTVDEVTVVDLMVGALARLCRDLAEQGRQHRAVSPPTSEAVAAMARLVADAFVSGMRAPVRLWLGSFMRDRRGAHWATDDDLLAAAGR